MSIRDLFVFALSGTLAACSTSLKPQSRDNDMYAELSPSEVYVRKGIEYMEQGNLQVALHDLRHAVELDHRNSEAYNALGVLQERLEHYGEAEASFDRAVSLAPDSFGAQNNYGRFLCNRGKYAEGLGHFQRIIDSKLYNTPWIPLTNAGICARGAGNRAGAEQYFRKALELDPGFAPALLEMARLSFASGQHMSARAFVQRFHQVAAPSPDSLWLAIENEMAMGNVDAARDYANTLRNSFPDSKEAVQARHRLFAD